MSMKEFKHKVAIIGGGMSGIMLAISLKQNGVDCCIIEAKDRIGKKILASGNGKCNILNSNLDLSNYNNQFPKTALSKYPFKKLQSIYASYGLVLKSDEEGRVYPFSESANTVLNVFIEKLSTLNVPIYTNEKVVSILKEGSNFVVKTENSKFMCEYVVLSSGSNATFGCNAHALLAPFGHKTTILSQSLVPIKSNAIKGANGVKTKAIASLYINNKKVFEEFGELLFKDNAISGILAFKMSAYIARAIVDGVDVKNIYIDIDFAPNIKEEDLKNILDASPLKDPLMGLLHKAIAQNIKDVKDIKHYKCNVQGLMGLDNAQVTSGGLDVSQFNENTMESKIQENIYAIGEVLDVDGQCGGYNLAFAAVSALLCSDSIINKCK